MLPLLPKMSPHQEETYEDCHFSFGNTAGIAGDDLIRVQRLIGSPEHMDRSLAPRYDPRTPKGHWHYEHRERYGARQIIGYPLPIRTQTMAKYRQEMMAQVERMPEETYELSLKDIVELPKPVERLLEKDEEPRKERAKEEEEKRNKVRKWKDRILGLKGIESGVYLLKMSFPIHFYGKRKSVAAAKVSPKPVLCNGEKLMMAKASESGKMSRSSSSSTTSRKMSSCYPFLPINRGH